MKNKLNFWYILLGAISIILIFLYFGRFLCYLVKIFTSHQKFFSPL